MLPIRKKTNSKRKVLTFLTMLAISMTVLSGCGKEVAKNDEPNQPNQPVKTETTDSGKKPEDKLYDPVDFSNTFDLDFSDTIGANSFIIPVLENTNLEDYSSDISEHVFYSICSESGYTKYLLKYVVMQLDHDRDYDNQFITGLSNYVEYSFGENDNYFWWWRRENDNGYTYSACVYDESERSGGCLSDGTKPVEGRAYTLEAYNKISHKVITIEVVFEKETNLYGKDCIEKDGVEYINRIKEVFESLTL